MERLVSGIVARRWIVLGAALVLTGLGVWGALEVDFLTSRKAMMPADTEVGQRLNRYMERFGAANDLILVLEGAPRPVLEKYASELARELERSDLVQAANERVDLLFLLEHAYLMVPPEVLEKFDAVVEELIGVEPPERLDGWQDAWKRTDQWLAERPDVGALDIDRKTAEESLHLMLFFLEQWVRWLDAPLVPESIAWHTMLARHGAEALASGYYASRNGDLLFVFVRPSRTSQEFQQVEPFILEVRARAAALAERWRAADRDPPQVALAGLPAVVYEEFVAVQHDIVFTISTAAGLIILLILAWLRSLRWALVVFVPMALGVVWNIGLAYLLIGHLTIITSGFTAILFGLGVDYGIFMSSRIIEERGRQPDLQRAVVRGAAASAGALVTAGGATVLIFAALAFVEFSGFAELGVVAASGVALVLISTFVIQPVLFHLMPPRGRTVERRARRSAASEQQPMKIPGAVNVALVLVALAGAGLGGWAATRIPFNYDVMSLLPGGSEAAAYQRRMLEESDYQAEVVIFTADSVAEARTMAARVAELDAIAHVQGITELFPPDAEQRSALARRVGRRVAESEYARRIGRLGRIEFGPEADARIDQALERMETLILDGQEQAFSAGHGQLVEVMEQILEVLEMIQQRRRDAPEHAARRTRAYVQTMLEAGQAALEVLRAWSQARPLAPRDLPDSLRQRFFSPGGQVALYAFPAENIYDEKKLDALMEQVYSVSESATGFPTTHQVFSHMVVRSFHQGTLSAMLVAVLWIGLVLRRLRGLLIASLPLLVGGGWMMAAMWLSGMEFNFANIIGLPLVMGLAVDYGVWFAHRHHDHPDRNGWQIARLAGRAILLAAGTTLAGLGAITLASYRGVSTMGVAITIGLLCCVTAALLVSPAIAQLLFRRKP